MVLTAENREEQVRTRVAPGRRSTRPAAWEVAVLAAYAALLAFALLHHERWFDEAQAWLLARDASVKDLLVRYPRYEGSPPLWQLLLAVPAKLGAPFWSISVVSGAVAFAGAVLIVRKAPFPPLVRAAIPFTYWVFFQYGVVARSYVLLGPVLWLLATTWPRRDEHPVRLGVLLALLSLVSFHGFLIAASLAAIHLVRHRQPPFIAAAVAWTALLFAQLRTPPDISTHASFNTEAGTAANLARAMVTGAFANRLVILAALAATIVWLWWSRRFVVWALPTAAVVAFSALRYGNVWHQGVLVEIWLFALWLSFGDDRDLPRNRRGLPTWLPAAAVAAMCVVLSVELVWTAKTVRYDRIHRYSAAAATAAYLRDLGAPDVDVRTPSAGATALQPYFDRALFRNINHGECPCFWWWSKHMPFDRRLAHLPIGNPAAIVVSDKVAGLPQTKRRPPIPGYHVARYFRGALYIRNQIFESEGFWVLVADKAPAS